MRVFIQNVSDFDKVKMGQKTVRTQLTHQKQPVIVHLHLEFLSNWCGGVLVCFGVVDGAVFLMWRRVIYDGYGIMVIILAAFLLININLLS